MGQLKLHSPRLPCQLLCQQATSLSLHPPLANCTAPASRCVPQIFEAYGLGREVVDTAFVGSVSRIGGMSLADIQREVEAFWAKGFPDKALTKLDDYGFIQSRPKGEYHANNQVGGVGWAGGVGWVLAWVVRAGAGAGGACLGQHWDRKSWVRSV
jgi:hypothetical protein